MYKVLKEVEVTVTEYVGMQIKADREKAGLSLADVERGLWQEFGYKTSSAHLGHLEKGYEQSSVRINELELISKFFNKNIGDYFINVINIDTADLVDELKTTE
jgi:transcriptional regulator with XRE-family HTH domain